MNDPHFTETTAAVFSSGDLIFVFVKADSDNAAAVARGYSYAGC